jgi:hypothetical protein
MRLRVNSLATLPNLFMHIGVEAMLTRNTRRASRLTLALGGLLITATVSAADVQSQARGVLIGQRPTHAAVSEATPAISGSMSRPRIDAQQQAAGVLLGQSREISKSPSTRMALRTPRATQSEYPRQLSNSQEMAQKVVLGIGGE